MCTFLSSSCVFSCAFFLFVLLYSGLLIVVLFYFIIITEMLMYFLIRERKGVGLDGKGGEMELEGVMEGETVDRIHCINMFLIKEKMLKPIKKLVNLGLGRMLNS